MFRRLMVAARIALCTPMLLAGCGSESGSPSPQSTVVIDGSSTVFKISRTAQIEYMKDFESKNPGKAPPRILVSNRGTGGGFDRYLQGEVDIVDASRAAKPGEEERAKAKGFDWTRFLVGHDGITIVVHPSNTFVQALTVDQLKKLFAKGSTVKTWKDLDPSWPDRKIVFYTPDDDSGTYEFFVEAVLGKEVGQRQDTQQSANDNTLVMGVSGDEDGIGYFGYAYYASNSDKLRAVPIKTADDAEPVLPNPETILAQKYKPLSRPLYLYAKNQSIANPATREFLSYYLSHIEDLTTKSGYVPPTPEERSANLQALDQAAAAPPPSQPSPVAEAPTADQPAPHSAPAG
jgi:phosphate transport system substrate-binding protein